MRVTQAWKQSKREIVWHNGLLGIWCVDCGEFVPLTEPDTRCETCDAIYRVNVMVRKDKEL